MPGLICITPPDGLVGDHFKALVEDAGYTNVRVTVSGDMVEVFADELADHMPPAEERSGLTDEECHALCAEYQAAADEANADDVAAISALAASYVPPPAPEPEPSLDDIIAAKVAEAVAAALGNS